EIAQLGDDLRLLPVEGDLDLECVLLEVEPLLRKVAGVLYVPAYAIGIDLEVELEGVLPLELALDSISSLLCKSGSVGADDYLDGADHFAHSCLLAALGQSLLLKHSMDLSDGCRLTFGRSLLLLHGVEGAADRLEVGGLLLPVATGDGAHLGPVRRGCEEVRLDCPPRLSGGVVQRGLGHASGGESLEQSK